MPIYEYHCEDCGADFDKFVRSPANMPRIECPECHSERVRKRVSLFGAAGGASTGASAASCSPSGG